MPSKDRDLLALTKMGIPKTQAKIYLTIARLGQAKANEIAKKSQIDRAATYRLIARLQEKGLVQKNLTVPAEFTAIPLKNLVSHLFQRERRKFSEFQKEAEDLLCSSLRKKSEDQLTQNDYMLFSAVSETIIYRAKTFIDSCEKSVKMLTTLSRCRQSAEILKTHFEKAMERGVTIQYLVEKPSRRSLLPKALESLSQHPKFDLRYVPTSDIVQIAILDAKRVSIVISVGTDYFKSSILVTDNSKLLVLANNYFEFVWHTALPVGKD